MSDNMAGQNGATARDPRTWRVGVRGFDFEHVHVRARTRSQARMIVALAFKDAGWGSVMDGLRHTTTVRLDPLASGLRLVSASSGLDVGMLAAVG